MPYEITGFQFPTDPKKQVVQEYDKSFQNNFGNEEIIGIDLPAVSQSLNNNIEFLKSFNIPEYGESKYDIGVRVSDLENLEYVRGNRQSSGAAWLNGFISRTGSVIPKFFQGVGYIGGFMSEAVDAVGEGEFNIEDVVNNSFSQAFQNLDDELRKQLPVYATSQYEDGNLWQRMGTDKFWADDVFDALAFAASAYIPGAGASGIIGNLGKLALKDGVSAMSKLLLKESPKLFMTVFNTVSEAGFEAQDTMRSVKQELAGTINPVTGLVYTDEEITAKAAQAAKFTFKSNLALLMFSNYVQSGFMLGNTRRQIADMARKVHLGEAVQSSLMKNVGKNMALGAFSEGLWEEGLQNSVQQYQKRLQSGMSDDPGMAGVLTEWTHNWSEIEGQESMLLGAALGMAFGAREGFVDTSEKNKMLSEAQQRWAKTKQDMDFSNTLLVDDVKNEINKDGTLNINKAVKRFFDTYFNKQLFNEAAAATIKGDLNHANFNNAMASARYAYGFASNPEFVDLKEARKYMHESLDKIAKDLGEEADNVNGIKSLTDKAFDLYENSLIEVKTPKKYREDSNFKGFANLIQKSQIVKQMQIDALEEMKSRISNQTQIDNLNALIESEQGFLNDLKNPNQLEKLYENFRESEIRPQTISTISSRLESALSAKAKKSELSAEEQKQLHEVKYKNHEYNQKYGTPTAQNDVNKMLFSRENSVFSATYNNKELNGPLGIDNQLTYNAGARALFVDNLEKDIDKYNKGEITADEVLTNTLNQNNIDFIRTSDIQPLNDIINSETDTAVAEKMQIDQDIMAPENEDRYDELNSLYAEKNSRIKQLGAFRELLNTYANQYATKNDEVFKSIINAPQEARANNLENLIANTYIDKASNPIMEEFSSNEDVFSNEQEVLNAQDKLKNVDTEMDNRTEKPYYKSIKDRIAAISKKLKDMLVIAKNNLMRRLVLDKKLRESQRKTIYNSIGIDLKSSIKDGKIVQSFPTIYNIIEKIIGKTELEKILDEALQNNFSEAYVYKIFGIVSKSDLRHELVDESNRIKSIIKERLIKFSQDVYPMFTDSRTIMYNITHIINNPIGFIGNYIRNLYNAGQTEYKKTTPVETLVLTRSIDLTEDALSTWHEQNVGIDTLNNDSLQELLDMMRELEALKTLEVMAESDINYEDAIKSELDLFKKLKASKSNVIPSRQQVNAVRQFIIWFNNKVNDKLTAEDALNELGELARNKGANSMKLWANLKGVAGTGKTTLAKWIVQILGLKEGEVYTTARNEVLSKNLSDIIGIKQGKAFEEIKPEDIDDKVKLIIVDEIETIGHLPLSTFVEEVLYPINQKRIAKGIDPVRVLSLGDPTQITNSGTSLFDVAGYSMVNIYHLSPLLVPFRSKVSFINSFGDIFRSNKNKVQGVTAKSDSKTFSEASLGVQVFSSLSDLQNQYNASKSNGRTKIIVYSNEAELTKLKELFPNANLVYYADAQSFTFGEIYINLHRSDFKNDLAYNTAMYTMINRATDFVAMLDDTQTFGNMQSEDTGDYIKAFEDEKNENTSEYEKRLIDDYRILSGKIEDITDEDIKEDINEKETEESQEDDNTATQEDIKEEESSEVPEGFYDNIEEPVEDIEDEEIVKNEPKPTLIGSHVDKEDIHTVAYPTNEHVDFRKSDGTTVIKTGDKAYYIYIVGDDGVNQIAIVAESKDNPGIYYKIGVLSKSEADEILGGTFKLNRVNRLSNGKLQYSIADELKHEESTVLMSGEVSFAQPLEYKYDMLKSVKLNISALLDKIKSAFGISGKVKLIESRIIIPVGKTRGKRDPNINANILSSEGVNVKKGMPYLIVTFETNKGKQYKQYVRLDPRKINKETDKELLEPVIKFRNAVQNIEAILENKIKYGSKSFRVLVSTFKYDYRVVTNVDGVDEIKLKPNRLSSVEKINDTLKKSKINLRITAEEYEALKSPMHDIIHGYYGIKYDKTIFTLEEYKNWISEMESNGYISEDVTEYNESGAQSVLFKKDNGKDDLGLLGFAFFLEKLDNDQFAIRKETLSKDMTRLYDEQTNKKTGQTIKHYLNAKVLFGGLGKAQKSLHFIAKANSKVNDTPIRVIQQEHKEGKPTGRNTVKAKSLFAEAITGEGEYFTQLKNLYQYITGNKIRIDTESQLERLEQFLIDQGEINMPDGSKLTVTQEDINEARAEANIVPQIDLNTLNQILEFDSNGNSIGLRLPLKEEEVNINLTSAEAIQKVNEDFRDNLQEIIPTKIQIKLNRKFKTEQKSAPIISKAEPAPTRVKKSGRFVSGISESITTTDDEGNSQRTIKVKSSDVNKGSIFTVEDNKLILNDGANSAFLSQVPQFTDTLFEFENQPTSNKSVVKIDEAPEIDEDGNVTKIGKAHFENPSKKKSARERLEDEDDGFQDFWGKLDVGNQEDSLGRILNIDEAIKYIRKYIPSLKDSDVKYLETLIINNSVRHYGQYKDGVISFFNGQDGGARTKVIRHELMHKIIGEFLTDKEKQRLFKNVREEFASETKNMNDKQLEDFIADKFMEFRKDEYAPIGFVKRIFNRFIEIINMFVNHFVGNQFSRTYINSLDQFLASVESGLYNNKHHLPDGSEMDMYRIIKNYGDLRNYRDGKLYMVKAIYNIRNERLNYNIDTKEFEEGNYTYTRREIESGIERNGQVVIEPILKLYMQYKYNTLIEAIEETQELLSKSTNQEEQTKYKTYITKKQHEADVYNLNITNFKEMLKEIYPSYTARINEFFTDEDQKFDDIEGVDNTNASKEIENSETINVEKTLTNEVKDFLATISYPEAGKRKKLWVNPRFAFVKLIQMMTGLQPYLDSTEDRGSKFMSQLEQRLNSNDKISVSGKKIIDPRVHAVYQRIVDLYQKAISRNMLSDGNYILPKNVKFITENTAIVLNVDLNQYSKEEQDKMYNILRNIRTESEAKQDVRIKILHRYITKEVTNKKGEQIKIKVYSPTGDFLSRVIVESGLQNYVKEIAPKADHVELSMKMASFLMEQAIAHDTFSAVVSVFNSLRERNIKVLEIKTSYGQRLYTYVTNKSKIHLLSLKGEFLDAIATKINNISVDRFKQDVKSILKNSDDNEMAVSEFIDYIGLGNFTSNGINAGYVDIVFEDLSGLVNTDRLDNIGKKIGETEEGEDIIANSADVINDIANSMTLNLAYLSSPSINTMGNTSVKGYDGIKKYIYVPGSQGFTALSTASELVGRGLRKFNYMELPFFKANIFLNGTNKLYEVAEHDGTEEDLYYRVKQIGRTKEKRGDYLARVFITGFLEQLKSVSSKKRARYTQFLYNISNKDAMPSAVVGALNASQAKESIKSMAKQIVEMKDEMRRMYGKRQFKTIQGTTQLIHEAIKEVGNNDYDKIADYVYNKFMDLAEEFTNYIIENKVYVPADLHKYYILDEIVDKKLFPDFNIEDFAKRRTYDKTEQKYVKSKVTDQSTVSIETVKMANSRLKETGKIEEDSPIKEYVLSKEDLMPLVHAFVFNNYINSAQLVQLVIGDFDVYKNSAKISKRLGSWFGPGTIPMVNDLIGSHKMIKIGILPDFTVKGDTKSELKAVRAKFKLLGVSEEKLDDLMNYFKSYDWSDSQGFMLEERRDDIRNGVSSHYELGNILKPLITGFDKNGAPIIIKYSSIVLTDSAIREFEPLGYLRDAMRYHGLNIQEKSRIKEISRMKQSELTPEIIREYDSLKNKITPIQEVVFKSAMKAFSPELSIEDSDVIMAQKDNFMFSQEEGFDTIDIEAQYFKLQFNPKTDIEKHVANPTQVAYFINLFQKDWGIASKMYHGIANALRVSLNEYERDTLLTTDHVKNNTDRLVEKLMDKINTRGNEKMVEFLDYFKHKLGIKNIQDVPVVAEKLITNFMSDLTKNVVDIRFQGSKLILQSEVFTEQINKETNVIDRRLDFKILDTPNGKILVSDAILPRGVLPKNIEKQIDEAIKNGERTMMFANGDVIGFRLPSSELHSAIAINIVGFYNNRLVDYSTGRNSYTNAAILPRELVWLHGSDFDVDSLFILRREYSGNKPIGYKWNEQNRVYEFDMEYENSDEFKESKWQDKVKYYKNMFIDGLADAITQEASRDRMISNIKLNLFKDSIEVIKKLLGNKFINFDALDLSNPSHAMIAYEHSYDGASAVGIVANTVKDFAYTIKASANKSPLTLVEDGSLSPIFYLDNDGKTKRLQRVSFSQQLSEEYDALLNLAIDNMNEGVLPILHLGSWNMSAYMSLRAFGMPQEMALLMYQTPIYDYIKTVKISKKIPAAMSFMKKMLGEELYNEASSKFISYKDLEKLVSSGINIMELEKKDSLTDEEKELMVIQVAVLRQMNNAQNIADQLFDLSVFLKTLRILPVFIEDIERLINVKNKVIKNEFGFDLSNIRDLEHVDATIDIIDFAERVLRGKFFLMDEKMRKLHNIAKRYFNRPMDDEFRPEDADGLYRKEFMKYIMQSLVINRDIENTKYKNHTGKTAWAQKATDLIRGLRNSEVGSNNFIKYITKSYNAKEHQFLVKFSAGTLYDLDDYVEAAEGFDELKNWNIDFNTGAITKIKNPTTMSSLQRLFIEYAFMTTGYTFGYTNYNFVIAPHYVQEYIRIFDQQMDKLKSHKDIERNLINHYLIEFALKNPDLVKLINQKSIKYVTGDQKSSEAAETYGTNGYIDLKDGNRLFFDISVDDKNNHEPMIGRREFNDKSTIYIKIGNFDGISYYKKIGKPILKLSYDGNLNTLNGEYDISRAIPANYPTIRVENINETQIDLHKRGNIMWLLESNVTDILHVTTMDDMSGVNSKFVKVLIGKNGKFVQSEKQKDGTIETFINVIDYTPTQSEINNMHKYFIKVSKETDGESIIETKPEQAPVKRELPPKQELRSLESKNVLREKQIKIRSFIDSNQEYIDIKESNKKIANGVRNFNSTYKEITSAIGEENVYVTSTKDLLRLVGSDVLKNIIKRFSYSLNNSKIIFVETQVGLENLLTKSSMAIHLAADGTIVINLANITDDEIKYVLEHELTHNITSLQLFSLMDMVFNASNGKIKISEINQDTVDSYINIIESNKSSLRIRARKDNLDIDAFEDLLKLYKDIANRHIADVKYGMTNIFEFVAETLADGEFRDLMKNTTVDSGKLGLLHPQSLLTQIIDLLAKMLGFSYNSAAYNILSSTLKNVTKVDLSIASDRTIYEFEKISQEEAMDLMRRCGG